MALNEKQRRFVDEYLVDLNATQAAIRAGYSQKTAAEQGARLLINVKVQAELSKRMLERQERTEITQDMVLKRYWAIATANPNELMQFRRVCCRHCHGLNNQFQWVNPEEFAQALAAAIRFQEADPKSNTELPTDDGGYGFNPTIKPNLACPKCFGEGNGQMHVNDTRELKGAAALLYAGVKQTREGLEVKVHDQQAALDKVAQHLGMFKQQHEHTGKDGQPIKTETQTMGKVDEETVKSIVKELRGEFLD